MTKEQIEKLQWLSQCASLVAFSATGKVMPYELAAAIHQLDKARAECFNWLMELKPTPSTSDESHTGD